MLGLTASRKRMPRARSEPVPVDVYIQFVRSLFDRGLIRASSLDGLRAGVAELGADKLKPEPVRPKNAYNLVRLLASAPSSSEQPFELLHEALLLRLHVVTELVSQLL